MQDLNTFKFAKYYFLWFILIHIIYIKCDLILIIAIANIQLQNEMISNQYNFYRLLIVVVIQASLRKEEQSHTYKHVVIRKVIIKA